MFQQMTHSLPSSRTGRLFTEKSIANLISHNGCRKRVYNVKIDARQEAMVAFVILKEGIKLDEGKGLSAKDLSDKLRVWFKIIMGCIHHRPLQTPQITSTPFISICCSSWKKGSNWYFQQFCSSFSGILLEKLKLEVRPRREGSFQMEG